MDNRTLHCRLAFRKPQSIPTTSPSLDNAKILFKLSLRSAITRHMFSLPETSGNVKRFLDCNF